jgi:ATP-dependent Clp protease ATP-binding subunit ClpC
VFNILLQILEDGRLTDNTGRVVSFKNTIVVMTSNAGAHVIGSSRSMGFGASQKGEVRDYEAMKESVMKEVKDLFRPEFINRVDELIVFHSLSEAEIRRITELMLKQVADRLEEQEIRLTWDESVTEKLAKDGYDPKFGARPLRRLIQRTVEDTLSEELLSGQIRLGQEIVLTVKDGKVVIMENETVLPEQTETAGQETEPGKEAETGG